MPHYYLPIFMTPKQNWWQKILRIKPRKVIKFVSFEEYLENAKNL
jgi:hypothetical protein